MENISESFSEPERKREAGDKLNHLATTQEKYGHWTAYGYCKEIVKVGDENECNEAL